MSAAPLTLRDFVVDLLVKEGAVVESDGAHCIEFLAPPALQQALRMPEFGRLWFGEDPPADVDRMTFESDWLERFRLLLGERGRTSRCVFYAEPPVISHPERIVEHGAVLQNAVLRLVGVTAAWTRYLLLTFHYTALSDDKRDGIVHLAVNLMNSSAPDDFIPGLMKAVTELDPNELTIPAGARLPAPWSPERANRFVRAALPRRIKSSVQPFIRGIRRRFDRDLDRLFDYYNRLWQESLERLNKQGGEVKPNSSRLGAIEREYGAKVADLEKNYALKVEVENVQTLEVVMPVRRFELLIKRRKKERRVLLDWNPIVRRLEPLPCEFSFTSEGGRVVCDEALHLVSLPAHGPCPECGKEYCRACHPLTCPKCRSHKW